MVEIKFKIKDDKVEELKLGFLKAVPKPAQYSHLTDLQYFKQYLKDTIMAAYITGKTQIAREEQTPDIQEVLED